MAEVCGQGLVRTLRGSFLNVDEPPRTGQRGREGASLQVGWPRARADLTLIPSSAQEPRGYLQQTWQKRVRGRRQKGGGLLISAASQAFNCLCVSLCPLCVSSLISAGSPFFSVPPSLNSFPASASTHSHLCWVVPTLITGVCGHLPPARLPLTLPHCPFHFACLSWVLTWGPLLPPDSFTMPYALLPACLSTSLSLIPSSLPHLSLPCLFICLSPVPVSIYLSCFHFTCPVSIPLYFYF